MTLLRFPFQHFTWIWKFPTTKRDAYKQFYSTFEIGTMNTISRYSGSQSPKDIRGNNSASKSFDVTFHLPPLLAVDERELSFSKECSTKVLTIASQGKWKLSKDDSNVDWVSISDGEGFGENTKVYITVEEYPEGNKDETTTRSAKLNLTRILDDSLKSEGETLRIRVTQSPGTTTSTSSDH